jgi:hypothetical protein
LASVPQEVEQWWAREKAEFYSDVLGALLRRLTPQERQEIQQLLGVRSVQTVTTTEIQAVRVPVAPPITSGAPVPVGSPTSAYGTIDETVGNPAVSVPSVAVRTSPFAQTLFSRTKPFDMLPTSAGGVLPGFIQVDQTSTITFSGVIDPDSGPQVLYVTYDAGQHWPALAGGQAFPAGSAFAYSIPVESGDIVGFGTAQQTKWDRFSIQLQTGVPIIAPQGQFGAVPTSQPGTLPYPVQFVPVSAFPQIVGTVKAGTGATANTPLVGPYTVPSNGTIGVFGFIASGSAYFTVALESVNGQYQYGGLNSGVNQTPGAWVGATIQVAQGDIVVVSVSSNCTCGTLRVTFTPST